MTVTSEQAMGNATRMLEWAESETDRDRMSYLIGIADSWMRIAELAHLREHTT